MQALLVFKLLAEFERVFGLEVLDVVELGQKRFTRHATARLLRHERLKAVKVTTRASRAV